MFLSFVWALFSHSSCTSHASSFNLVHIFSSFPPSSWFICLFVTKRESILESILVYIVISIWLMCTFLGWEILPCAHSEGEKATGDMHIPRGRKHFFEKTLFCLVLPYACFLVTLLCFELCLVSMLCCSHRIMLMCWICIHPYAIVLYWLHVWMIICFAIWSL